MLNMDLKSWDGACSKASVLGTVAPVCWSMAVHRVCIYLQNMIFYILARSFRSLCTILNCNRAIAICVTRECGVSPNNTKRSQLTAFSPCIATSCEVITSTKPSSWITIASFKKRNLKDSSRSTPPKWQRQIITSSIPSQIRT